MAREEQRVRKWRGACPGMRLLWAALMAAAATTGYAQAVPWWDASFGFRRQITVSTGPAVPFNGYDGYTVRIASLDTGALVADGKLQADCDDLRVLRWDGTAWTELPRHLLNCNDAASDLRFKLVADIPASASDGSYYLYYGNPSAGVPAALSTTNVYAWFDDAASDRLASYMLGRGDAWHGTGGGNTFAWSAGGYYSYDTGDNVTNSLRRAVSERDVYVEAEFFHTNAYPNDMTSGLVVRYRRAGGSGATESSNHYYASNRADSPFQGDAGYAHDVSVMETNRGTVAIGPAEGAATPAIAGNQWRKQALAVWAINSTNGKFWDNDDAASLGVLGWPALAPVKAGTDNPDHEGAGDAGIIVAQDAGRVRNLLVRRYVEPEPALALGAEVTPTSLSHFDVIVDGGGGTCFAEPVTIVARDFLNNVLTGYTGLISLSTSTNNGDWSLNTGSGTLTPGAPDSGAAGYQFAAADGGMAILDLMNTRQETLTVTVQDSATGITSTSAPLAFQNNAYRVINDPVQVAGRPQQMRVEYWRRTGGGCNLSTANGHGGIKRLKAWLSLDAAHPAGALVPGIVAVDTLSPLPVSEPPGNNVRFAFSGGVAYFALTTSDVGKYVLNLRDGGSQRRGNSPTITTRPFALHVDVPGNPGASTPSGAVFTRAGADFSATVRGILWQVLDDADNNGVPDTGANLADNPATPSFAWDTILSAQAPYEPAGGVLGTLANGALAKAAYSGGAATAPNLRYSEVGSVTLNATAYRYLDSPGVDLTGSASPVGRFRPDHFAVSQASLTNRVMAACAPAATFTYMDEAMEAGFKLSAKNAAGAVTQNYTTASGYAKLDPAGSPASLGFGARDGAVNLTARLDLGSVSGGFVAGEATVAARVALRRASPDNPDGPFEVFELGIAPQDGDGTAVRPADLDLDVDGAGGNDHVKLGQTRVRFGRLRLANAYGSELLDLPIPIRVEHWNGIGFATHADDGCTRIAAAHVLLSGYQGNLNAGETSVAPAPTLVFSGGVGNLQLARPGAGNSGSVQLRVDLNAEGKAYLRGRWDDGANPDANADTAYDDDPAARGSFGQYKAGARLIDLRESY